MPMCMDSSSHSPYKNLGNHNLNKKIILRNGCRIHREMSTKEPTWMSKLNWTNKFKSYMLYNNLMFFNAVHIDKWLSFYIRTMLSSGFVACTICPTTTWKELLICQLYFVIHLLYDYNLTSIFLLYNAHACLS